MTESKARAPRKLRLAKAGDPNDDRPLVRLGAALDLNVEQAAVALAADPELYQRSGALVRVVPTKASPAILPHGFASLRVRLSKFGRFEHWHPSEAIDGGGEWVPCLPSEPVTKALHESPETWGGVRHLEGVPDYPVLLPSGEVLDVPGYEASSCLLYQPAIDFGAVPPEPTQEACVQALRWLWTELCYDFPFRGMGYAEPGNEPETVRRRYALAVERPDAWGVISAILTLLGRPHLSGDTPAHLFDASTPGSGKGLQVDAVMLVVFGRILGKLTWPKVGGMEADHTLEQMLGGEARSGAACVVFDEIEGAFGGPPINKVLTGSGRAKFRILGVTETQEHSVRFLMLGTGNNITTRDNTHRRAVLTRLEPPIERPEEHKGFRHPNLPGWIRQNRAKIVRAALMVLRGYVVAGKPDMGVEEWGGGFESWTMIARAIRWAGGGEIMRCRPSQDPAARNEDAINMGIVLDALAKIAPDGITVARFLDALYPPERIRGRNPDGSPLVPDGHDDTRDAINVATKTKGGRRPDSVSLGNFFRTWTRRPVGSRQLQPMGLAHSAQKWGVALAGTQAPAAVATCDVCGLPRGRAAGACDPCGRCRKCLAQAPHHPDGCHC